MSLNDQVDMFLEDRLGLESTDMELVQSVDTAPIVFRGPGRIVQDEAGALSLEMIAFEIENTNLANWFNAEQDIPFGTVMGPELFYRLAFTDAAGQRWSADHIRPIPSWGHPDGVRLSTGLRRLSTQCASATGSGHSLRLLFRTDAEIPFWYGPVKTIATSHGDLEIRKTDERLDMQLLAQEPLDGSLGIRIEEALRFLTARNVAPRIVIASTPSGATCELRSPDTRMGKSNLDAPLSPMHVEYLDHGWPLFLSYFEYVAANAAPGYWHPITYHLHNAAAASGTSIDGWAIGMSVAVEGLANLIEVPGDPEELAVIKSFQSWIGDQIKKHEDYARFFQRVSSMLGNMTRPSAKDRLYHLVREGAATEAYAAAWGKLRNPHVHPQAPDLKAVRDNDLQPILSRLNQVTTLLYEVTFYLIGYGGPYQNYGADNAPVRHRSDPAALVEGAA